MEASKITELIEKTAPLEAACSWDNSGIQLAALSKDISTVAVCLDPTPLAIDKALELGAQYILTHHPLLMKAKYLNTIDAHHHIVRALMRHDAWLYSAHTSLDASSTGPVSWLAKELGLINGHILETTWERPCVQQSQSATACQSYGLGFVGDLENPLDWSNFITLLGTFISLDTATLCGSQPSMIRRIGYCTGSGSSLASRAFAQGADIFITGDVKYHTALDTLGPILDVGHFSLEEEMMRRFALQLQADLAGQVNVIFLPSSDPLRPLGSCL